MYHRDYHFSGCAVRVRLCWFYSVRDKYSGDYSTVFYVDDGFGNLVQPQKDFLNLLLRFKYGSSH